VQPSKIIRRFTRQKAIMFILETHLLMVKDLNKVWNVNMSLGNRLLQVWKLATSSAIEHPCENINFQMVCVKILFKHINLEKHLNVTSEKSFVWHYHQNDKYFTQSNFIPTNRKAFFISSKFFSMFSWVRNTTICSKDNFSKYPSIELLLWTYPPKWKAFFN